TVRGHLLRPRGHLSCPSARRLRHRLGAHGLRSARAPEVRGGAAGVPVLRSGQAAGARRAVAWTVALGCLRGGRLGRRARSGRTRRALHRDHGGAADVPGAACLAGGPAREHTAPVTTVDVAVIGAGIHGAGMAQAAAAAGHSVLLLEQSAIAAGTSSRSSKLIHGGLRYLETGQFHLVRESLRERTLLLQLAPELVQLRRFYVPIYRATRRRPWQIALGLALYGVLAGFSRGAAFGALPRRRWGELDGLSTEDLQRVFHYQDAQTDDRALTRAVVASAQSLGAQLLCPARCLGATLVEHAVQLRYRHADGRDMECRARVLVNAAGPWADELARHITPAIAVPPIELVQGSHLLLPLQLHAGCYYLESPRDGRA